MLRIPCPRCGSYIFISDAGCFIPCPQCGAVFSGKHGPEKRRSPRVEKKINFSLSLYGRTYKASTSNFSAVGVEIKVFGRPPLTHGAILAIPLEKPSVQAKIIWVERLPDRFLAGLEKL
jgi:uncharacterized Zn finger protein (UPF0148 family)